MRIHLLTTRHVSCCFHQKEAGVHTRGVCFFKHKVSLQLVVVVVVIAQNLERRHAQYKSELELQTKRRDALMKRFKSVDANFRIRRESTGSSWSSSRSESSNDSDKGSPMSICCTSSKLFCNTRTTNGGFLSLNSSGTKTC